MIPIDAIPSGFDRPAIFSHASFLGCQKPGIGSYANSVLRRTVGEVRVGETRYRLREPVTLIFYPYVGDGMGELIPEPDGIGFDGLNVTGKGTTIEAAFEDWSAKLHSLIQTLLAQRPWEMTSDEARNMAAVERLIDIAAYNRETPSRTRQIGTVTRRRPIPDRIKWEDGLIDHVNLSQMPPEFAAFHAGQRFEAISVRDAMTGKLLRVVFVGALPRLPRVAPAWWEKLQTFAEAPEVGWDEID